MKIAHPPHALPGAFNLRKQQTVFDLCFNPLWDIMLPRTPLALGDLWRAHSAAHVDAVLTGATANGFGDAERLSLTTSHALKSAAAMYWAARAAINGGEDGQHIAFAPVSGFHHAGWDYCAGFCTFNGLMITALKLREEGLLPNGVLIIDGDGHYGDGTASIIERLKLDWVTHLSLDRESTREASIGQAAIQYIFADAAPLPDLVMYQAGADAHKEDPYRAGYLNDEEWRARDLLVFRLCRQYEVPVAWNLAGGYNEVRNKTIYLHSDTYRAARQVYYPELSPPAYGQSRLSATAGPSGPEPSDQSPTHQK